MTASADTSFDNLVAEHFGAHLPEQMAADFSWTALHPDVQQFILRMFPLMACAGYQLTDFTPYLVRALSTMVPSVLPFAWGGRIPPLTVPNRHKKLDAYVANCCGSRNSGSPVFVDLGCGFPPVTTAQTAGRFGNWRVYGVDRCFAEYVLYDGEGHYACYDAEGAFQYFQPQMTPSGRAMYANPSGTRAHFETLFETMHPLIENSNGTFSQTVEAHGNRLIHHHIRNYETGNLQFIESDIDGLELPPARVIRCMNVLIYFTCERRRQLLRQTGQMLTDDGIIIAGTNGFTIDGRYTVYRKRDDDIVADEFAFGMDNLRTFWLMPWFTIHENDPEAMLLAGLMGTIRSDRSFWPGFTGRVDELLESQHVCRREKDGFLHFATMETPGHILLEKHDRVWTQMAKEGYLEGALEALSRAGYVAWKNQAGDIAIRPPTGALP